MYRVKSVKGQAKSAIKLTRVYDWCNAAIKFFGQVFDYTVADLSTAYMLTTRLDYCSRLLLHMIPP